MDVRGIEITNQLRSAIRAKLLELGVRYDEELPDYILVMIVNKKSRQQMNDDLHLFLESNTEPFVNWLHDQVLKKLQKVTVKKKCNKEIGPTTYVKEEKERKKIKIENQQSSISEGGQIITKVDRDREFEELVGDLALLNKDDKTSLKEALTSEDKLQKKKNNVFNTNSKDIANLKKNDNIISSTMIMKPLNNEKKVASSKLPQEVSSEKINESSTQSLKRTSNIDNTLNEKHIQSSKRSKISDDFDNKNDNKFKSSINKPRITSVISVKTRLGIISPQKCNIIRNTLNIDHLDVERNKSNQRNSFNQNINLNRKNQQSDNLRTEQNRNDKIRSNNHLKFDSLKKIEDSKDKVRLNNKSQTIKSRLGIYSIHKQDEPPLKSCNSIKISKPRISNVKSRLGVRKRQQIIEISDTKFKLSQVNKNNKSFQEADDDFIMNTSMKSHIIAIKKKQNKNISESLKKQNDTIIIKKKKKEDDKIVDEDQSKISSKIIVTPRPLKPLQPSLKRATQSLLLRAVAEANQSVVMQKKMDPCLKEQNPVNKIKISRNPWRSKILSVNLNSKKRFVMEKIQIELTNPDIINSSKPDSSQVVTEEHLDVVKSLFKRSDDKQKFLVTLNGYNNNIIKKRNSNNEEHTEVDVNEDDELTLTNNQYGSHIKNDLIIDEHIHDINKDDHYIDNNHEFNENEEINKQNLETDYTEPQTENNGNDCTENLRLEENVFKKKRKLSPIVYNRFYSSSPKGKPILESTVNPDLYIQKRPLISSVITTVGNKSSEKCRYWPNCTLGIKCAYYHPEVLCSSFPVCKFGEKCAYKHPKCKFGSSCTKVGCMFSHPPVKCKYHPYCMKPGCPFSHPKTSNSTSLTLLTPDISNVRAKFTWKKKE